MSYPAPVKTFLSNLFYAGAPMPTRIDECSSVVWVHFGGMGDAAVCWDPNRGGFGIYRPCSPEEIGFGERPDEIIEEPSAAAVRVAELLKKP